MRASIQGGFEWALAGRDVQKKYYPDPPPFTALIRHTMMELIASHFTEEELKKRGLLAPYHSASKPGAPARGSEAG